MIRIGLDLSDISDVAPRRGEFNRIAQMIVERAANEVYNEIHRQANDNLNSTRQTYKRNINRPEIGRLKASITLTGQLPNMIEQGASAFDMKDGFSRSRKAKRTRGGGWHLTIPFRYASAGAVGENEAFAGVLPAEVYGLAKGLKGKTTREGGKKGGRLDMNQLGAVGHGVIGKRKGISGSGLSESQEAEYTHKAPKFLGLQRNQKTYQAATSSSYVTFRRVSSNSDVNSWIHRGLKAADLMPKAVKNVNFNDIIGKVMARELA